MHPARQPHGLADVAERGARRRCGCGRRASAVLRQGHRADTPRASGAVKPAGQPGQAEPRRDQAAQRVADEELALGRGRPGAAPPRAPGPARSSRPRSTPGSRPEASGGVSSPPSRAQEDVGDRALADLAAAVEEQPLVDPRRQRRPRPVVARRARWSSPAATGRPGRAARSASRDGPDRGPGARAARSRHRRPPRRGRASGAPAAARRRPRAASAAVDRRAGRTAPRAPRRVRSSRARCVGEPPTKPAVAPAEGLDQRQAVGKGSAKRAFHSASSYSESAVESATTPPPTFSTAAPSAMERQRADRHVEGRPPVRRRPADRAAIGVARPGLELADDLHRPQLRRAGHRAAGKERREDPRQRPRPGRSRPTTRDTIWCTVA